MIKIPPPWNDIDSLNEPSFHANKKFCEEDLARSGLTTSDMPVFSEPFAVLTSQFATGVPLVKPNSSTNFHYYTIPYYNIDGTPLQDKTGRSKMYRKRTTDKEHRYISPLRSLVGDLVTMPYFNPLRLEKQCDKDLYVIVEGEKKYSKLLKEVSLYGCAIGGKDMWQEDGKVHPMLLEDILAYAPKEVRIVPDGDWRRQDIFASYSMLIFKLRERLGDDIRITVADLSGHLTVDGDRVGIDDYLHAGKDWRSVDVVDPEHELLLSADVLVGRYALDSKLVGRAPHQTRIILENVSNADKLFHKHPLFSKELLSFDIDADQAIFRNTTDSVLDRLQVALQRYCRVPTLSHKAVQSAANIILREREFSPFRDWLDSLKWDGVNRIERLFVDCVQTDEEPESYRIEAARRVMLQSVSRILAPGGKADTVVVLVGRQGIHKTMFWEMLSYESYADLPKDIKDKDAMMILAKKRFIIIEEMAYYRGKAAEDFKAMISRREDTYRAPYGHDAFSRERRCLFVGNHNNREFMRELENRRLMPVWASKIDLKWLEENIEQLYAEGVARYKNGEQWWSEDEAIWEESKSSYMEEIPNQERIEAALKMVLDGNAVIHYEGEKCFKLKNVAACLSDLRLRNQDIGQSIRRLGWTDVRPRIKGFQGRLWVRVKK